LSVIENALSKLRRAAGSPDSARATARVIGAPVVHPEGSPAAAESRYLHKRATIDLRLLRADGYLPDEAQDRRFADYYHRIKRPLIQRAFSGKGGDDLRLILVTSALPGEGKSFTTLNLALSMARERDMSVLLVDADLPTAHVSQVLGLQREPGLLDALHYATLDVESLVLSSDVPGLDLLPAGGPTGASADGVAELLSSARMREIMTRLNRMNTRRLVLLDSPPLLVSSEARALAQIPGQIVLVVRVGYTPRRALLDAIDQVEKKKLQGLVLNDAHITSEHGYYRYPYGAASESLADRN
jgi:protein-tyrosine kinase